MTDWLTVITCEIKGLLNGVDFLMKVFRKGTEQNRLNSELFLFLLSPWYCKLVPFAAGAVKMLRRGGQGVGQLWFVNPGSSMSVVTTRYDSDYQIWQWLPSVTLTSKYDSDYQIWQWLPNMTLSLLLISELEMKRKHVFRLNSESAGKENKTIYAFKLSCVV